VLTNMIGYDIPEITEAVDRQLRTGVVHTSTLYLIRQQIELAEKVARVSGIPDARVFFTNSGSEANEAALLMATNLRRSHQIMAIRNSYHGRTFATIAVTGHRSWSASALSPLQVVWLPSGDRVRGRMAGLSDADHIETAVEELREVLATVTAGDVAALIAEPIQGVGGSCTARTGCWCAQEGAGRARHPADRGRGADRLGPHRRPLLGLPGARRRAGPHHVRQGHRERVRAGRRGGPGRGHQRGPGDQLLHVRRQPGLTRGRQRRIRLRARPRPAGEREAGRRDPAGRPARGGCRVADRRRGPRARADDRSGVRPSRHDRARRRGDGPGVRRVHARRPAGRQGRPVQQRAADGAAAHPHRGGGPRGSLPVLTDAIRTADADAVLH
jgi:hypothetical protein